MAQKAWLGNKVRRLRRDQGLAQVEMARRLGISPSYLNLIEHNQRPLTLPLLLKLGQEFNVDLRSFSDNEDARLMAELTELLGEPLFREHDVGREDLKQLVATSPSACHALLSLFRGYRSAREDVRALAERVSDDTYLATSMHELRQLLATIRSFSEILHDYADLDDAQRQQIHKILVTESEKVTSHLDQMRLLKPDDELKAPDAAASAMQEINDFLHDQRNHFPAIEDAAQRVWRDHALAVESLAFQVPALLNELHGITVEVDGGAEADSRLVQFDEPARRLRLSPLLPAASRNFQAARQLGALACEAEIAAILDGSRLKDPELRMLAAGLLARYFAGALLMPYGAVLSAARACRYDLDLLSQQFQVSFEQVCHRLTTLQRPGAEAIPFHFQRVRLPHPPVRQCLSALERPHRLPLAGAHRCQGDDPARRQQLFHDRAERNQAGRELPRAADPLQHRSGLRDLPGRRDRLQRRPRSQQSRGRRAGRHHLPTVRAPQLPTAGLPAGPAEPGFGIPAHFGPAKRRPQLGPNDRLD
jgi:transcriptional regulator with XRE-family HTH domain